ncbi:MAG: sarcosine oxidase subunit delta [Rhodobacteraceae bacterium]|nr:sarcosine oxidase subunit delta [Paracoccaceae bacterium]
MLLLKCPYCGAKAEETEFSGGGEAHLSRQKSGSTDAGFAAYMFERRNPKGVILERWHHAYGCGKWFHAARSAVTLEVFGTYSVQALAPPKDIIAKIRARLPEWEEKK